jgi:hypothetical protein
VLDVGAGDGALLDAIAATGRERLGLERSARRPDVSDAALEELDPPWSAVVLWHSLEHLRDPVGALRAASDLLGERGGMVVAVPNADSLQAKAFGDRWLALDLPRHLVHIPARALLARLRESGLRVTRVSHFRGGQVVFGWLHGLVARVSGLDLYDAIRRPEARSRPMSGGRRVAALALGILLAPVAVAASAVEIALRRGGSVYVEAVRG